MTRPPPLRVVSYNVRYFGHALKGLASTLASQRAIARRLAILDPLPDVVCLQEIETISLRSRVALRGGRQRRETQLEAFMREVEVAFASDGQPSPYEGFYFRAHVNQLRGVPIYTTGLAILVRTARVQVDHHNVASPEHITHHQVERWKDRKQTRICAHMRVLTPRGPLHVFNTHLSLPTPFARTFWSERMRMGWGPNQLHEARSLAGFVRRRAGNEPFIVCGDFNSAPGSPVYRYLTGEAGFESAQAAMKLVDPRNPRAFPTAGFMRLRMHLDHVFYGNGLCCLDLAGTARFGDPRGLFAGLSDHVPLIATLAVGRPA